MEVQTDNKETPDVRKGRAAERLLRLSRRLSDTRGQALIETAVFSCLAVFMAALAADMAWLAFAAGVMSSAARQTETYIAQGGKSTAGTSWSSSFINSRCTEATTEMQAWGGSSGPQMTVNTAAAALNASSWTYTAYCSQATWAAAPVFKPDPEAAYFQISATQITTGNGAAAKAPVAFKFPGIPFLNLPNVLYGRTVYMRVLN